MTYCPSRYFTETAKEANTYEHKTTGLHQLGRILHGRCHALRYAFQRSKHKILSMGYNGFPTGCSDDDFPWVREGDDNKYFYSTHSELNAILNYRGGSLEGSTIYVTLFPCNECAKAIIQCGIREVVYDSDKYASTPGVIASKKMLRAAGVTLRHYEHTNREVKLSL